MDELANFLSILASFIEIIGVIFAVWFAVDKMLQRKIFQLVKKYFRKQPKTSVSKKLQPTNTFPIPNFAKEELNSFDLFFDKLINDTEKPVKSQSEKQLIKYTQILVVLIVIPFILIFIDNPPIITLPEITSSPNAWTPSGGMNVYSLLWMYIFLFGIIGATRGWAKEILVIFSSVVALALNLLLSKYFPFIRDLPDNSISLFWIQSIILFTLIYFGYQTVNFQRFAPKASREKFLDIWFGTVLGGVNGYFISGTLLAYFHRAEYPYERIIAPATDTNFLEMINRMMTLMPPNVLGEPWIYFTIFILFALIILVYV